MSDAGFHAGQFMGRFHPALVHLPIGFLVLLALLELFALKPGNKHLKTARPLILAASFVAALVTVVSGWLLADAGGYDERLLLWHRWSGVGVAMASLLLLAFHMVGLMKPYRILMPLTVALVAVTGHFGGSLTHGADYLGEFAPGPLRGLLGGKSIQAFGGDITKGPAFETVVQPILGKYCVACHGPQKSKAGLRLDDYDRLMKGSENGPVVIAGKPEESELVRRLSLPEEHDDHMPPAGKPQLSDADIKLLAWWLASGASADKTVAELNPPAEISEILSQRRGSGRAPSK